MIKKASAGRPERPIDEGSPFAEFAGGLRRLRASAGLTVRDLADRTGYSAAAISAMFSAELTEVDAVGTCENRPTPSAGLVEGATVAR